MREAMAYEVGGCVKGAVAGVVIEDEVAVAGPGGDDLLGEFLGEQEGARELDRLELLARAEVEQCGRGGGGELGGEGGRGELPEVILALGVKDVIDRLLHGDVIVAFAHLGEGLFWAVGAGLAATDVVAGEERAAGGGEGLQDFAHGEIWRERDRGEHGRELAYGRSGLRQWAVGRGGKSGAEAVEAW